jgi:hypothetical protein
MPDAISEYRPDGIKIIHSALHLSLLLWINDRNYFMDPIS